MWNNFFRIKFLAEISLPGDINEIYFYYILISSNFLFFYFEKSPIFGE